MHLKELTYKDKPSNLVIPSPFKPYQMFSENTITYAIKHRMHTPMVGHGFRSVVLTGLNRLGFPHRLAQYQIGHSISGVEEIYNTHDYFDRRKEMMQVWADHLDDLLAQNQPESDETKDEVVWEEYQKELLLLELSTKNLQSYNKFRKLAEEAIATEIIAGKKTKLTTDDITLNFFHHEFPKLFTEISKNIETEIKQLKIKHKEYEEKFPDHFLSYFGINSIVM